MEEFDLIIGIHSIVEALKNKNRVHYKLVATEEGLEELNKSIKTNDLKVELLASHKLQEEAKGYFRELDLEYHRVPSGVFLLSSKLEIHDVKYLYNLIGKPTPLKILCLDQVTDVHNAAAILRTASFYGVDAVVVPDKKSFGLTPSFFRIASGAAESVPLVGVNKLTKTITKLKEMGILCVALSEHASEDLPTKLIENEKGGMALVLGREDVGISNAVLRVIDHHISLKSQGDIKSLNVSIAAAICMEKCFKNL